jgi:hypothetical protein
MRRIGSSAPAAGLSALALAALALTGCATVMAGTQQEVRFVSEPPGATASVPGIGAVQTPGSLELDRLRPHRVTFVATGYAPVTVDLDRSVNPWVLGNAFCGILPGLLVDFLVGGAFVLPREVRVVLKPASGEDPAE